MRLFSPSGGKVEGTITFIGKPPLAEEKVRIDFNGYKLYLSDSEIEMLAKSIAYKGIAVLEEAMAGLSDKDKITTAVEQVRRAELGLAAQSLSVDELLRLARVEDHAASYHSKDSAQEVGHRAQADDYVFRANMLTIYMQAWSPVLDAA